MMSYEAVGTYRPGGRNVRAGQYDTGGALPFRDKAVWIGPLSGSWFEMGRSLGAKTGEMILASSDYWWKTMCDFRGFGETVNAIEQYWRQLGLLDPDQQELMRGIVSGAQDRLSESPFESHADPLHADALLRVYAAAVFDSWIWCDPDSYRSADAVPNTWAERFIDGGGCNSVAVLGSATAGGHTITSQVRHTQQAGLCYQASAVFCPGDGASPDFWTVGNVPSPNGLLVVNRDGVSISHHFGGATTQESLAAGCYGGAYGVPWLNMLFYAIRNAHSAAEAADLLIHGSESYRTATGRKTVLREGCWNWMVCDENEILVLEVSPDRYAIRRPGEFTGVFRDSDYIVCANHFLSPFSFDENDVRTDVPMTVFNANRTSERRFWTLMWEMHDHASGLDPAMLQYLFSQTYLRERESGEYVRTLPGPDGNPLPAGQAFACVQGTLDDYGLSRGTNAAKIAILDRERSECLFCLGNPMDWVGDWDSFRFGDS